MIHIALYQPIIPQNVGNIARTCVGMDAHLHIIGPTIVDLSDKAVKRAGLDYWDDLTLTEHESPEAFFTWADSGGMTTGGSEYLAPSTRTIPRHAPKRARHGLKLGYSEPPTVKGATGVPPVTNHDYQTDGRDAHPTSRDSSSRSMYAVTKFAATRFDRPAYKDNDILLFGSEREGLPPEVHARFEEPQKIAIPIPGAVRSYNLANTVAITLATAMSKAELWPSDWAPKEGFTPPNTFTLDPD